MTPSLGHFVTFSFVTPLQFQWLSDKNAKSKVIQALELDDPFSKGLLLQSTEKGVTYPLVHISPTSNVQHLSKNQELDENYQVQQGMYQELSSIHADLFGSALDDLASTTKRGSQPNWSTFCLLLGFKQRPTSAYGSVLENHWKDWTGARYLALNLPDEFGPLRLTFYKRINPDDGIIELFKYVVLVECVRVLPQDEVPLKDFVQRMRADKMPFYSALYEDRQGEQFDLTDNLLYDAIHRRRYRSLSASTGLGSMESSSSNDRPNSQSTFHIESPTRPFTFSRAYNRF